VRLFAHVQLTSGQPAQMTIVMLTQTMAARAPFDTHSLKSSWTLDEIRQLQVRKLDFSPEQVSVMHTTIKNDTPTLAARAARAGAAQP